MAAPEMGEGPRVEPLNAYIDASLAELKVAVEALPSTPKKGWAGLNTLFLRAFERALASE